MGSEISKIQQAELSPLLSAQERSIVIASKAKKISEMGKREVANVVVELVGQSFVIINQPKMSSQDREIMQDFIIHDLFAKFSHLTIEEFKQAFHMGLRGEFKVKPDDVIFMSVSIVYGWMKSFCETVKREAMKKQRQFDMKKEKDEEPTDEQKQAKIKVFLENDVLVCFNYYKAYKAIADTYGAIYQILDNRGFIKISNDRKKEIYQQADKLIRREFTHDREFIKDLNAGKEESIERVKIKARQMALKVYFDDLIEMEIELEDEIKEYYESQSNPSPDTSL